jgi:hypothetical protein
LTCTDGRTEHTAAWCAARGAQRGNPVLAARHAHLTGRERNRLADGQARAACAATLLRWLHAIVTRGFPFDADIAAGLRPPIAASTSARGGAMAAWPATNAAHRPRPRPARGSRPPG